MTGRDLIIYIMQHSLEDELVYEDGKLLGFMTAMEAAVKFDVGVNTIHVWYDVGMLDGFKIGNILYIPGIAKRPNLRD